MKKQIIFILVSVGLILSAFVNSPKEPEFVPGSKVIIKAHNAYPDHGKYADRLDRAIAVGFPVAIEQDLAWVDNQSLMIHGAKNAGADDPSLENYFFPKVRPVMEKALKDAKKEKWPLIILYLDIKNDPPEHLENILKTLDKYNDWITTAVKTDNINKQSPLDLKPLMVIVEDKQNDIKQKYFYDNIPVGGKIRVFGSIPKFNENPNNLPKEKREEAKALLPTFDIRQLVVNKADNYHRWFGINWEFIEKRDKNTGDWTQESNERLKNFVDYGHKMGYFVGVFCLDGFSDEENQGWEQGYNFGSKEKAEKRWNAAIKVHTDFISTDQMEDLANDLKSKQ